MSATYSLAGTDTADTVSRIAVSDPDVAAALLRKEVVFNDRMQGMALLLDYQNQLIGSSVVSVGSVSHTFMAPREVFRTALLAGASAIICGSSHPSGKVKPSGDDRAVARRLAEAGELLGIDLLDYMILGQEGGSTSLARAGVV